jgi:FlaA1/EpsC-like NDP-sugar epimerase
LPQFRISVLVRLSRFVGHEVSGVSYQQCAAENAEKTLNETSQGQRAMKIFVTGGAGFIGSNFIRYVLKAANNHAIINYDNLTYAGNLANLHSIADHPDYRFIKGDICDAAAAEAATRAPPVSKFALLRRKSRQSRVPGRL